MAELIFTRNGQTRTAGTPAEAVRLRYDGWSEQPPAEAGSKYDGAKVAELRAEIDRRNQGRDEASLIPTDGVRADLVAALVADDAGAANPAGVIPAPDLSGGSQ